MGVAGKQEAPKCMLLLWSAYNWNSSILSVCRILITRILPIQQVVYRNTWKSNGIWKLSVHKLIWTIFIYSPSVPKLSSFCWKLDLSNSYLNTCIERFWGKKKKPNKTSQPLKTNKNKPTALDCSFPAVIANRPQNKKA